MERKISSINFAEENEYLKIEVLIATLRVIENKSHKIQNQKMNNLCNFKGNAIMWPCYEIRRLNTKSGVILSRQDVRSFAGTDELGLTPE